jgi:hypothetical protein
MMGCYHCTGGENSSWYSSDPSYAALTAFIYLQKLRFCSDQAFQFGQKVFGDHQFDAWNAGVGFIASDNLQRQINTNCKIFALCLHTQVFAHAEFSVQHVKFFPKRILL